MAHPRNKYDDDDGRVICNMDVEGMRQFMNGKPDQQDDELCKEGREIKIVQRILQLAFLRSV